MTQRLFNQAGIPIMCIVIGLFAGMLIQKRSNEALITQVLQSAAFSARIAAGRLAARESKPGCAEFICYGGGTCTIGQIYDAYGKIQ